MSKQFVPRRRDKKKRREGLLDRYLHALVQTLQSQRYQRDTIRLYLVAVDTLGIFAQRAKTGYSRLGGFA